MSAAVNHSEPVPCNGTGVAAAQRQPTVLLFHRIPRCATAGGINAEEFEEQVRFLRARFTLVAPHSAEEGEPGKLPVLLTFDDGFRSDAEVVAPILRRYQVPAVFFMTSRHATPGQYLWFSYLQMLAQHFRWASFRFGGERMDMSTPRVRCTSMRRLFDTLTRLEPHPSAIYKAIEAELPAIEDLARPDQCSEFAGMTTEQLGEISADPLFTLGVHTVDHPFLTRCESDEARWQITQNKRWLESISGKLCTTIAYPFGEYDASTIRYCQEAGLTDGYGVVPKGMLISGWEVPRIGVYTASLGVLQLKARWPSLFASSELARLRSWLQTFIDVLHPESGWVAGPDSEQRLSEYREYSR